jgi:spore coat protein CotH
MGGATSGGRTATAGTSTELKYATTDEGVFPQDRILQVALTLPTGAWEKLIKNAALEQYVSADVTIDGQSLGSVGLRFKGEYSLWSCVDDTGELNCDKLSLKMKFTEYDPQKRFYGLKRLNFNNLVDEAAIVRETISYKVYRDMGIIAPRTSFAVVTVNGQSQGLYTVVEEVDGRFTDDRFKQGDGNLFKEAWPGQTDSGYFSSHLENNQETATFDRFQSFATEMLGAADEQLPTTLGKWMDLDYLMTYMAVDYAIANWDGVTTFYCGSWGCTNHNYYVYQEETQPKFWLIPWDLNATLMVEHWLGNPPPWDELDVDCATYIPGKDPDTQTKPASCDPMIRALALNRDGYHAAVKRVLEEGFVPERLNAQIDEIVKRVTPAVEVDPFLSLSRMSGSISWTKGQILKLRERLEAVVE